MHPLCGRKQGVPDVKPFKHDEVVVYNDGAKFQVRMGLTWQCYGAFAVVYRRRGIVLERRVWKAKYVSSANRPIKVVLCDLQLSIVANEAADESTVYVPILLSYCIRKLLVLSAHRLHLVHFTALLVLKVGCEVCSGSGLDGDAEPP